MMTFQLTDVVPWGRTFDEYVAMFSLTEQDLGGRIVGCGDGPASFNAEASRKGHRIVSADPTYRFSATELRSRVVETAHVITDQMRRNQAEFVWDHFHDVDALVQARLRAMDQFLLDYSAGLIEGRYVEASLPTLPFPDGSFDLALCSHFLFLYSQQHDLAFHIAALKELCRIAREVRVFPLMELRTVESRHLEGAVAAMRHLGFAVEKLRVAYEFQRGGNQMLRIASAKAPRGGM